MRGLGAILAPRAPQELQKPGFGPPWGPQVGAKMEPKWSQNGTKINKKSIQNLIHFIWGPSWLQSWPKLALSWPKLVQVGPKLDQFGPKMAQVGPKLAQVGPKLAPSWPQVGPKLAQVGPYLA